VGQADASQHEKHCDCVPKYVDELEQPFLSGPLVQIYGTADEQGLVRHWSAVHAVHLNSHDVTSQQLLHMCWKGQNDELVAQPPADAPDVHSYGASMGQRPLLWHWVWVQEPLQLKRGPHVAVLQHLVHSLVLFHASGTLPQPPLLLPAAQ
jgi:hypothetical protein